jgi:hypothetical protein
VILALLISCSKRNGCQKTRARSGQDRLLGTDDENLAICVGIVRICPSICGPLSAVLADISTAAM